MVKYETTLVDLEAGSGGVYQTTVAAVPVKSSRSWIWKTIAAICFICLCATAALFFTGHVMKLDQTKHPEKIFSEQQLDTPSEHGRILMQIAENTKAAIHLHGQVDGDSLKWMSGVDQSFAQGGLKLVGNEIHIPSDGLYFVYSQVSYTINCGSAGDESDQKFLSHSIWRDSDAVGKPMALQNSAQSSACQSQEEGKRKYSTIYLGAVFRLNEDDKLSTKTSLVSAIDEDSPKTFFGVFAL